MNDILKIAAAAVAAAICAAVIKKQTPDIGIALTLTAGALILGFSLTSMEAVVSFLDKLSDTAALSPAVLAPVLKVTGIAVISRTAAEICRDAKENGLAVVVETAASALALLVSLPLLQTVLSTITELI